MGVLHPRHHSPLSGQIISTCSALDLFHEAVIVDFQLETWFGGLQTQMSREGGQKS